MWWLNCRFRFLRYCPISYLSLSSVLVSDANKAKVCGRIGVMVSSSNFTFPFMYDSNNCGEIALDLWCFTSGKQHSSTPSSFRRSSCLFAPLFSTYGVICQSIINYLCRSLGMHCYACFFIINTHHPFCLTVRQWVAPDSFHLTWLLDVTILIGVCQP